MGRVVEEARFKWFVDDNYPASKEPIRQHESSVLLLCGLISDKKKIFVDVGACTGKYTIPMSKRYKKVIAIEPNPENLKFLRKNIELNKCKNIEIIEKAVSDTKGTTKLALKGAQSHIDAFNDANAIEVEMDLLDSIVEHADVIKIDVEGAELGVVKGAMRLIDESKPILIVEHMEYWFGEQPKQHKDILKLLKSKGYKPFNYNFAHWVYVPEDKLEGLLDLVKGMLMSHHIFYEVIVRNLKEGKAWYFGLPCDWWHGMSILEFYHHLNYHALDEKEWESLYNKTLERYLK